jgi:hypothetical protein
MLVQYTRTVIEVFADGTNPGTGFCKMFGMYLRFGIRRSPMPCGAIPWHDFRDSRHETAEGRQLPWAQEINLPI